MTHQQAGLQQQRHSLHDTPRQYFKTRSIFKATHKIVGKSVELGIRTSGFMDFIQKYFHRFRSALHGAEDIETDNVACSLPDAVERGLAIQPLHEVIGDEAVAAMTFERLRYEIWSTLANPILRDWRGNA